MINAAIVPKIYCRESGGILTKDFFANCLSTVDNHLNLFFRDLRLRSEKWARAACLLLKGVSKKQKSKLNGNDAYISQYEPKSPCNRCIAKLQ